MKKASYVVMECVSLEELHTVLGEIKQVRTVSNISNMGEGPMLFRIAIYGELPEDWVIEDDFDYSGEGEYDNLVERWNELYNRSSWGEELHYESGVNAMENI